MKRTATVLALALALCSSAHAHHEGHELRSLASLLVEQQRAVQLGAFEHLSLALTYACK